MPCGLNAQCTNTFRSFECQCNPGFTGDTDTNVAANCTGKTHPLVHITTLGPTPKGCSVVAHMSYGPITYIIIYAYVHLMLEQHSFYLEEKTTQAMVLRELLNFTHQSIPQKCPLLLALQNKLLTPTLHSGIYMYFGTQGKQCIFSWHSRDTKAK